MNKIKITYNGGEEYFHPVDNIPHFVRFANDFQNDIPFLISATGDDLDRAGVYAHHSKIFALQRAINDYGPLSDEAAEALFKFLQVNYVLEQEEQLLRPLYFAAISGDCDDQMIFTIAFYLYYGVPPKNIQIVESGHEPALLTHIYTKVKLPRGWFSFDALPGHAVNTENADHRNIYQLEGFFQ